MNRLDWQRLAERRLVDATALLKARRWSAAYYLAGYAVECGLKSALLVRVATLPDVIFEDRRFSEKCWTHDLAELIRLADLKSALEADIAANMAFGRNWLVVKDWSEQSRYQEFSTSTAKKLVAAITDKQDGVMRWIRARW